MAITQSESGLTTEQYNALKASIEDSSFRMVLHRANLDFEFQDIGLPETASEDFDSVYIEAYDYVVYAVDGTVYVHARNPGVYAAPAPVAIPTYSNTAKRISLVFDGTNVYAFFRRTGATSIRRLEITVSPLGITMGAETSAVSVSTALVQHIAAVSKYRLYWITEQTNGWRIRGHNIGGFGISNNVYYQYPIESMDAISVDGVSELSANLALLKDVIVVATQTPGITSVRAVNDSYEKYIEISGGILAFTAGYSTINDHFDVDVVDRVENYRIRKSIRLARIGDKIVCTAFSVSGTEKHNLAGYRMYTTVDGENWSMGEILPLDYAPYDNGLKLLDAGNFIYAMDDGNFFKSYKTIRFGNKPEVLSLDITSDVESADISQDQMLQINLSLNNEDGKYDNHPLLNDVNILALEHYVGYFLPGDTATTELLVAATEIDSIVLTYEDDTRIVKLSARDHIAWMTDKSEAENAEYWDGQLVQADTFIDNTQTRYGGLRHTAVQSGVWQTQDGVLDLRSSNEEGISFNTANPYIWNGTYRSKWRLARNSGTEFAGLIFRAVDKDNMWYAIYNQATDKIQLYMRLGGTSTLKASSASTMGWASTPLRWRWLEVRFRYAKIEVYYSLNGIDWELAIEHYAPKVHAAGTMGPLLLDRGYVGHIGKGYSPEDNWTFPEFTFPDFEWLSFDWNFDFLGLFTTKGDPSDQEQGYYALERDGLTGVNPDTGVVVATAYNKTIKWTTNWNDASPTWSSYDLTALGIYPACVRIDEHAPDGISAYILGVSADNDTFYGLYHIADLAGTPKGTIIWQEHFEEEQTIWYPEYQCDMDAYFNEDGDYAFMAIAVETTRGTVAHVYEGDNPKKKDEWETIDMRNRVVSDEEFNGYFGGSFDDRAGHQKILFNLVTRKLYTQAGIFTEWFGGDLWEVMVIDLNTLEYNAVVMDDARSLLPTGSTYAVYDSEGNILDDDEFRFSRKPSIVLDGSSLIIGGVFEAGNEFLLPGFTDLAHDKTQLITLTSATGHHGEDTDVSTVPNVAGSDTQIAQAFNTLPGTPITPYVTTNPINTIFARIENVNWWPNLSAHAWTDTGYTVNDGGDDSNLSSQSATVKFSQDGIGIDYWVGLSSFTPFMFLRFAEVRILSPTNWPRRYQWAGAATITATIYDAAGTPYTCEVNYTKYGQYNQDRATFNNGLVQQGNAYAGAELIDDDNADTPQYAHNWLGGFQGALTTPNNGSSTITNNLPNKILGVSKVELQVEFTGLKIEEHVKYLDMRFLSSTVEDYETHGIWRVNNPTNPSMVDWDAITPVDNVDNHTFNRPVKMGGSWDGTGYVLYSIAMEEPGGQYTHKVVWSPNLSTWQIADGTVDYYEGDHMEMIDTVIVVWGEYLQQHTNLGLQDKRGNFGTSFVLDIDFH